VLPDAQGRPLLPSIVRYSAEGRIEVGYAAQAHQTEDPVNTILSVKRFMGRGRKDVPYIENLPYDFVDAPGMVQICTVAGRRVRSRCRPILKVLRARADVTGGDLSVRGDHSSGLLTMRNIVTKDVAGGRLPTCCGCSTSRRLRPSFHKPRGMPPRGPMPFDPRRHVDI
jgi:hypothetical protein